MYIKNMCPLSPNSDQGYGFEAFVSSKSKDFTFNGAEIKMT